jgi:hypothetical protein
MTKPSRSSRNSLNSIGYSGGRITSGLGRNNNRSRMSQRPITPQIKAQELNIPKAMINVPKPQNVNQLSFNTAKPPILDYVDKQYGTDFEPRTNQSYTPNDHTQPKRKKRVKPKKRTIF